MASVLTTLPTPLEVCPVTRVDGEKCELVYSAYNGESELQSIMDLIDSTLSEPYSIFTYRYFINNWPSLCILTRSRPIGSNDKGTLMGVIICKADVHKKSKVMRGYLAMLVVDKVYRKLKIGTKLAVMAINEMANLNCKEAVLETEITNKGALRLYERLGFIRQKRLPKYYLNGNDAFRLKLWIPEKKLEVGVEDKPSAKGLRVITEQARGASREEEKSAAAAIPKAEM
jgi:N-alpha-acetyltransferase 30